MLRLFVILVLLLVAPSGYFLYNSSKDAVIAEMVAAAKSSDVDALAARVDFPAVRAFLKEDLARQKGRKGPYAMPGGPEADKIDGVVDYYVQPENIDILYYLRDLTFEGIANEDFIQSTGYAFPYGFQMTLGFPKGRESASPGISAAKDHLNVKLVFRLDGLTWKVREMHVPVYMVPRHTYSPPAVQVFGRR